MKLVSLFDGVAAEWREQAAGVLTRAEVDFGTVLMEPGESDASMLIVLDGRLSLTAGEVTLDEVGPGESVGAGQLFGNPERTWTVKTVTPTNLLVIDRAAFDKLASAGSPVAHRIERLALESLGRRISELDDRMRRLATGMTAEDAGVAPTPALLERLWEDVKDVLSGRLSSFDEAAAMAAQRTLSGATSTALETLATETEPVHFKPGQPLIRHGTAPDEVFVLLQGLCEALVPTGNDTLARAGEDRPGHVLGLLSVMRETDHTATVVAREPVLALRLSAARYGQLIDSETAVGSVLRRASILSLADWIAEARWSLEELQHGYLTQLRGELRALYEEDALDRAYGGGSNRAAWTRPKE